MVSLLLRLLFRTRLSGPDRPGNSGSNSRFAFAEFERKKLLDWIRFCQIDDRRSSFGSGRNERKGRRRNGRSLGFVLKNNFIFKWERKAKFKKNVQHDTIKNKMFLNIFPQINWLFLKWCIHWNNCQWHFPIMNFFSKMK